MNFCTEISLFWMWSDSSLFFCYQIYGISYLHLIIKQKNASPKNWSKCTYHLMHSADEIVPPCPQPCFNPLNLSPLLLRHSHSNHYFYFYINPTTMITITLKFLKIHTFISPTQWRSHWGSRGGRVPPLTATNLPKIGKKREKSGKIRKKWGKRGQIGKKRQK